MDRRCGGGPEGSRTLDLCDANAALSQLSYKPEISSQYTCENKITRHHTVITGIARPQLDWCARRDSNPRPTGS